MSQGYTRGVPVDTDVNLAANSDLFVPSQKATKTYVDNKLPQALSTTSTPQFARLGLGTAADGTALLKLGSLAGILLATAGVVDVLDYAAGTFTPTFTFTTPGNLSVSYAEQTGSYIRIGGVVIFTYRVRFTPTHTTASGTGTFGALPLTANSAGAVVNLQVSQAVTWPASTTDAFGFVQGSSTNIIILSRGTGVTQAPWQTTQFPTATERTINFAGFYFL